MTAKTDTAKVAAKAPKAALTVPTFSQGEVPESTTAPKVNIYDEPIGELAKDVDENGRSKHSTVVVVPAAEADQHIRYAQKAGIKAGATTRKRLTPADGDNVSITFWTVKRITRKHDA